MTRIDRRNADQLRRFKITKYFQKYPAGSVLIETGNTKVICATQMDGRLSQNLEILQVSI